MALLAIDLGGTKLAVAGFSAAGVLLSKDVISLDNRAGPEVGKLITDQIKKYKLNNGELQAIGVSVPGICHNTTGTAWVPNIPGWEDYPLIKEIKDVIGDTPVCMDSDRACSILGEQWQGNAKGCKDAIFLSVGTGIGAGILVNENILRGSRDIAGAIGWMALQKPYEKKYIHFGCFEYYASGDGIARLARELLTSDTEYQGKLRDYPSEKINAQHIFAAFEEKDPLAYDVIQECIEFWGMAAANLISLFNPEKIIFGGGVFGPAIKFLPMIKEEAAKWAQPISMKQVSFEGSRLGGDAPLHGAGFLALKTIYLPNFSI